MPYEIETIVDILFAFNRADKGIYYIIIFFNI